MDKRRLDYLVAKKLGISRSAAVNLIELKKVKVDGQIKNKISNKISPQSLIEVKEEHKEVKKKLKLKIIYEDEDCLVIDKPAGILAHNKGAFSAEETIASWLFPHTHGFDSENNRAGIVHRLDRATSGVMICAKTPELLLYMQKQFSTRKVKKSYNALIQAHLDPPQALIEIPIERNPKDPKRFRVGSNGKPASTVYKTLKTFIIAGKEYSLVELLPKTGRTHQLRVHLAFLKHPIVGDDFYDGIKADRLYLHATELELTIPSGERKTFKSSLPASFANPKIKKDG